MDPQVQDEPRKPLEEQAPSSLEEKQSLTSTPTNQSRKLLETDNRHHRLRHLRHLNVNIICSILIAIGLAFIIFGRLLGLGAFIGWIISNSGWVVFLCGIAMFVAILKRTLDV